MSEQENDHLTDRVVPKLPRGVRLKEDKARGVWTLLAPERTLQLDPIGVAILNEVDGMRDLGAIVALLAERYNAPAEVIARDVRAFLRDLGDRRMLDLVDTA
ncbi:MAG: pyrroloquinoline quinone biosynthesis peptide chaperone PqqD [Geminicoccaceae bacterium]